MTDAEKVAQFWPIILSTILLIAWLVKLEVGNKQNKKDNERNEKRIDDLFNLHGQLKDSVTQDVSQLKDFFSQGIAAVRESLARIEGALHSREKHDD